MLIEAMESTLFRMRLMNAEMADRMARRVDGVDDLASEALGYRARAHVDLVLRAFHADKRICPMCKNRGRYSVSFDLDDDEVHVVNMKCGACQGSA